MGDEGGEFLLCGMDSERPRRIERERLPEGEEHAESHESEEQASEGDCEEFASAEPDSEESESDESEWPPSSSEGSVKGPGESAMKAARSRPSMGKTTGVLSLLERYVSWRKRFSCTTRICGRV